jgi:hypothetical protein
MSASADAVELCRRGVRHGRLRATARASAVDDAPRLWRDDRAIWLPGFFRKALTPDVRRRVASARAFFDRARNGADVRILERLIAHRLGPRAGFRKTAAAVEMFDAREIGKVYADEIVDGEPRARDLYAKLSWIAADESDASLRARFSFGSEMLFEWHRDPRRAKAADRFAEAVFPEGRALARHARLLRLLAQCAKREVRLSERIVYSNAPGGGAVFHHDAEPTQLGVLYGQFAGRTAWLASPKRDLAAALAEHGARGSLGRRLVTPARALKALDARDDSALDRLLNDTPSFTRALVERGALIVLNPGDVLVLPSHGIDACCWHSVFAPGETPSLAHSYGIFADGR